MTPMQPDSSVTSRHSGPGAPESGYVVLIGHMVKAPFPAHRSLVGAILRRGVEDYEPLGHIESEPIATEFATIKIDRATMRALGLDETGSVTYNTTRIITRRHFPNHPDDALILWSGFRVLAPTVADLYAEGLQQLRAQPYLNEPGGPDRGTLTDFCIDSGNLVMRQ